MPYALWLQFLPPPAPSASQTTQASTQECPPGVPLLTAHWPPPLHSMKPGMGSFSHAVVCLHWEASPIPSQSHSRGPTLHWRADVSHWCPMGWASAKGCVTPGEHPLASFQIAAETRWRMSELGTQVFVRTRACPRSASVRTQLGGLPHGDHTQAHRGVCLLGTSPLPSPRSTGARPRVVSWSA